MLMGLGILLGLLGSIMINIGNNVQALGMEMDAAQSVCVCGQSGVCTCGGADSVRTVFLNLFLFLSVSVQSMSSALGNSLRLNRASLS